MGTGLGAIHGFADPVDIRLFELRVALAHSGTARDPGGDAVKGLRVLLHKGEHLIGRDVAGGSVAHAPGVGVDLSDAQLIHLLLYHAGETVAQGDDDDHRPHADDNAQHGQKGPHFAGPQGFESQLEGLSEIHAPASSPLSAGRTTASGAFASPS